MRLTVFNGSPRGEKSNTRLLMEHFGRGFLETENNEIEYLYLNRTGESEKHLQHFGRADRVILAFPLYTDAMPGIVKHFIEALHPLIGGRDNPPMGFLVQSGFPEPAHSRPVAEYLKELTRRLDSEYLGTVIRGGVEGIQVMPPWMTRKLYTHFYRLGRDFGQSGAFNRDVMARLTPWERLSLFRRMFYRIGSWLGMTEMYWNMKLKQNNSFDKRFARPYDDRGE
jgi:NAD(P)H-dependent FMN reductase